MHKNAHTDGISAKFLAWLGLALFIVTFLVYSESISYPFVALDDPYVIYNNLVIREITPATIYKIFTMYDPELYMPLTFFTFQLNYLIGGLHPEIYHFTNILLHAANAMLVAWLIAIFTKHRWTGVAAGLLFALHPVNTEVVVWATARKELLSTLFFLIAFISYEYYKGDRNQEREASRAYAGSIIAFLLALLSKVTVFTLPVLLLLSDVLQKRRIDRKCLTEKIPYVVLSIIFVVIGLLPKEEILSSTTLSQKMLMASKSMLFYLWKFVWPVNLSIVYPNRGDIVLSSPEFSLAVIGAIAVTAGVLISLRWTRTIAFGFGFFLVAIAPTLVHFNRNAGIVTGTATGIQFASDHYLYVPMIGLLLLVAIGLEKLWMRWDGSRPYDPQLAAIGALFCAILGISGYLANAQMKVWANSETLFSHVLTLYPYSIASRVNLSVIYRKTGRFDEEKKILQEGLAFGPNSKIFTGLAAIAVRNGDNAAAEEYYKQAITQDPTNSEPLFGRGVMLAEQGKMVEAKAAYTKAIEMDPRYVAAYNNLGSVLLDEGNEKGAEEEYLTAVGINPSFREGHYNLGALYAKQKKTADAVREFELASELAPDDISTHLELVPLYLTQGKNSLAFARIKAVLTLEPDNAFAKALIQEMVKAGILGAQ